MVLSLIKMRAKPKLNEGGRLNDEVLQIYREYDARQRQKKIKNIWEYVK